MSNENIRTLADDLIDRDHVAPAVRQHIAETIVGEARGNPLFVVELVRHFVGMVLPDGGLAAPPDGSNFHLDAMILKRVGALPEEIVFTSCGTESNNTAIHSALACQPE